MAYLVTPGNSVVTERGHFGPNIPVEITDRDEVESLKSRGVIRDTKDEPIIPEDAPSIDNTLPPEGEAPPPTDPGAPIDQKHRGDTRHNDPPKRR